jgi:hypothetical protein
MEYHSIEGIYPQVCPLLLSLFFFNMDLIDDCATGVDLGIKNGDVAVGIIDCEEWISLDSTPIAPRVCVLDLDLEAISFFLAFAYFLFSAYSSSAFVAFTTSSVLEMRHISISFPGIFARWYFSLYTPPLILFPHRLHERCCRFFGVVGSPYSQNGSNSFGIFNMEKYEPRAKKIRFLACVIDEKIKI